MSMFRVARNPDPASRLPYVLYLPLEGGLVLKAREAWPRSSRVYCHLVEEGWPQEAEVLEEVEVRSCVRRGAAVDLILDRRQNYRSQFVFTMLRGRQAIFWQTSRAARASRPGARVPAARAGGLEVWTVLVDTREKYPYKFAGRPVAVERSTLSAGDYAVVVDGQVVAAVERKTGEGMAASLSNGSLAFVMAELATLPTAAVVVEGGYADLARHQHTPSGWLVDLVARLQVRYSGVPIVFCDNRKLAEEWTYRFLAAAISEHSSPKLT